MSISHLTIRQLRAIHAIYATGRVSAAAQRLNVSQSAVSVLLGQAEAAMDTRLFDRTTRSLSPTQAVEQMIGIVERILGDLDALDHAVRELKVLERGTVRIGATPATGIALLPAVVRRYKAEYPNILIIMNDCAPDQLFSIIETERVDFGLGLPPPDRMRFDWQPVHNDPLNVVLHRDHPLAAQDTVRWAQLDMQPLIASRRDYGVRELVEATLKSVGARANIVNEIGFLYSAEWMAACDMGLCVFPRRLAEAIHTPEVVFRPLVDPVVSRPISVLTRRGRSMSPPAARFVELLLAELA
ncbi:LysR family transcriptional regulator [Pseudooceanicola sediminis]|uniref:LysR family transcriptional regulator n=1 Tax=Pseudooceanicola sediminis TaxID=2211117 RepID=A0A399J0N4_9RHOB|nr:LysR substrate-binding domain-containing protein [Pseudooceanicola sediminis]KAA2313904.1 LysR family transcriptional regulator [Puniceibacterium sp. HSS470]RII38810.1 LysR family transcriptional regulator [Pseudooceanicola sediminis]